MMPLTVPTPGLVIRWPGSGDRRVACLGFYTTNIVVFLEGGEHFPVVLSPDAILEIHRRHQTGQLTALDFTARPILLTPPVLH